MYEKQPYTDDVRQQRRDMAGRCPKRDSNNDPRGDDDYTVRRLELDAVPTNYPHYSSRKYSSHKISARDVTVVAQYVSVPAGSLRDAVKANNTQGGKAIKTQKTRRRYRSHI